ncbi:hemerythrin [Elusimicrobium posterum]|uniref:hemerythrin family protein n=1 Tax=Elusimicrobium posterum TaxID=3116653 RepID=UPI003C78DDC7
MEYKWNTILESGHKDVDGQHKMLVTALNDLNTALETHRGPAELERMMEFLSAYTVKHFEDEEALQKAYNYPFYLEHKALHEAFKKKVALVSKRLREEKYNDALMQEVVTIVANWLTNHIKGDDFRMVAYIIKKQAENKHA